MSPFFKVILEAAFAPTNHQISYNEGSLLSSTQYQEGEYISALTHTLLDLKTMSSKLWKLSKTLKSFRKDCATSIKNEKIPEACRELILQYFNQSVFLGAKFACQYPCDLVWNQ
ncbi:hypothetical protein VP01_386g16 [Puccinia sorghi]|uniref:Uncharacterized protein n=1 Tax=Puccinia sorghi TaxID=27349 RepID=A0A0L6UTU1_9BASI|nr:hypothetical protein VP01_386g16 [Puccinia sorghi]